MTKPYHLGPARRLVNLVMTPLARHGIGGKSTYLLTTTGRRTGEKRTTPVILVEAGADRRLVAPYGAVGWVHNVRAHPEVSLRRGRTTEVLHAEEVGPEVAGAILQRYVDSVVAVAALPFFDAKRGDQEEKFAEEAARHPVFRLVSG